MKNWDRYLKLHQINNGISSFGLETFDICVCIPCFNEPDIINTLVSLDACNLQNVKLAVIVVVNSGAETPENSKLQNRNTYAELVESANVQAFQYFKLIPLLVEDIPRKHIGAGYARKLAMDYAVWMFRNADNKNGIIVSLDADCLVKENFIQEISAAYRKNEKLALTTQYFEHPMSPIENREAISQYELYLRYFKQALAYTGFPYAIHTVGSCFSVKADAYVAHGGMNRRQGGEDFYFLHKLISNVVFAEVNTTCVYPSSRLSNRVPFGTGPALRDLIKSGKPYLVYHPASFEVLKSFFQLVSSFYKMEKEPLKRKLKGLDDSLQEFLTRNNFEDKIIEINRNSASQQAFVKRFYQSFDAFQVVKYLNMIHTNNFAKIPVTEAVFNFYNALGVQVKSVDVFTLLNRARSIDRSGK